MESMRPSVALILAAAMAIFLSVQAPSAEANTKQIKVYKEAFPDDKPKCIACHAMEKPKKEGPHDLNDYGKKVKAHADVSQKEAPDAGDYQQAGRIESE